VAAIRTACHIRKPINHPSMHAFLHALRHTQQCLQIISCHYLCYPERGWSTGADHPLWFCEQSPSLLKLLLPFLSSHYLHSIIFEYTVKSPRLNSKIRLWALLLVGLVDMTCSGLAQITCGYSFLCQIQGNQTHAFLKDATVNSVVIL